MDSEFTDIPFPPSGQERREWTEDRLSSLNPDALFYGDQDEALIGYVERGDLALACYDHELMVANLMERDGSSREDALDWLAHNSFGSHVGENGPAVLYRLPGTD